MKAANQRKKATYKPSGYGDVTPFVIAKNSKDLLMFLEKAFGAVTLSTVPNADGSVGHAETKIGDSIVMMFDTKAGWPETPAFLRLYVVDCDQTHTQAIKAGATSVTEPTDMAWGDRVSRVKDPSGNIWWLMSHVEDVSSAELSKRYGEEKYITAIDYMQSADFFS